MLDTAANEVLKAFSGPYIEVSLMAATGFFVITRQWVVEQTLAQLARLASQGPRGSLFCHRRLGTHSNN